MAPVSFANFWNANKASPSIVPSHTPSPVDLPFPAFDSPASAAGVHLAQLPVELQFLILSHLHIRSLCKGLARTSHHWARSVDEHLRRQILRFVADPRLDRACTLVFEAQRPIDTLTHKHRLYFSHFGVTNSTGGAYTTTANFSFVPTEGDCTLSHNDVHPSKPKGQTDARDDFRSAQHQGGSIGSSIESRPAVLRNLPPHLAGRVRAEHCTSSVLAEPAGETSVEGARGRRPATFQTDTTALPLPAPPAAPVDPIHHPLDAYDWAGPVSSSVRAPSASRSPARTAEPRRRKYNKPTYRMQLDPLDSFETWILTLSVRISSSDHRNRNPSLSRGATGTIGPAQRFDGVDRISFETMTEEPTPAATIGPPSLELSRAMRWERRVAEGLDRVYRDWFHRPEPTDLPRDTMRGGSRPFDDRTESANTGDSPRRASSPVVTPELVSTFGAVNTALRNRNDDYDELGSITSSPSTTTIPVSSLPRRRVLEFDNSSCVLHLQPHSCSSPQLLALHPTLAYFYTPTLPHAATEPAIGAGVSSSYPPRGSDAPVPPLHDTSSSSVPLGSSSSSSIGGASWASIANSHSRYHALHSRLQASHRVELTWHAESIEVNAARLLSVLEEVEGEREHWERRNGLTVSNDGRVRRAAGGPYAKGTPAIHDPRRILAAVGIGSSTRWRGLEAEVQLEAQAPRGAGEAPRVMHSSRHGDLDSDLDLEVESRGTIPLWSGATGTRAMEFRDVGAGAGGGGGAP